MYNASVSNVWLLKVVVAVHLGLVELLYTVFTENATAWLHKLDQLIWLG